MGEHGRSFLSPLIQRPLKADLDPDGDGDEVELFNPHEHGGDARVLFDDGGDILIMAGSA